MAGNSTNGDGFVWVRRAYQKRELHKDDQEFYDQRWFPTRGDMVSDVIPPGSGEMARAKAGLGMTMNLGNYESMRVDVGVELPCRISELPDALGLAWEVAEKEIRMQIRGVRKGDRDG